MNKKPGKSRIRQDRNEHEKKMVKRKAGEKCRRKTKKEKGEGEREKYRSFGQSFYVLRP